jgi:hypothetical protein
MRQKKWFVDMTRELLYRLEQDKNAAGEFSSYTEYKSEQERRQTNASDNAK